MSTRSHAHRISVLIERLRASGAFSICTCDSSNFARGTTVLPNKIGLSVVGLSALAAIASVALPAAVAQSSVKLTAKQAVLAGLSAPVKQMREPSVGRLIVKLRAPSSDMARAMAATQMQPLTAAAGVNMKSMTPMGGDASVVELEMPVSMSEAKVIAARLASDPAVAYAEPDQIMKPFAVPNETDFMARQWNLFAPGATYTGAVTVQPPVPDKSAPAAGGINMPAAWDVGTGSSSVVIAIIDTGITNHLDLNLSPSTGAYASSPRFLAGYDFISLNTIPGAAAAFMANDLTGRDADPTDPGDAVTAVEKGQFPEFCDDNGLDANVNSPISHHGTLSAGVAAAASNNSLGIAGVAWDVKILPVRALGKCGGSMADMADAIRWASGETIGGVPNPNPAKIISVGAGTLPGVVCSDTLRLAVEAAINAGSVVIAATGNHGEFALSSPANCAGVISVTAHAINGESTTYANVGPSGGAGPNPTISAPGGGSPASLGALGPIDDVNWAGFYIWSTAPVGTPRGLINRIGTSMAAAQVAGVAALIKSKVPAATPAQISSALTTSVRPLPDFSFCAPGRGRDGQCGIGLLDATRALQAAGPPVVVTAPVSVSVAAGATASFTVEAIGVVAYQWIRAGVNIAGATGPSYTTPALAATDNNVAFAVNMSNSFGNTTSPAAVLTVSGGASNSPSSGGGALPFWQLVLLSALLLAGRVRVAYSK